MNYEMLRDILAARPKAFAFLAFLVVLNIVLVLYLSLYQRPELARVQGDWFAKREALAKRPGAATAASYQRDQRDLAEFQRRFIPKREFPSFLTRLYELASNNSLKLSGVAYKPTPLPDRALSYGISFTASGHYAALKSFISDVARLPEMVTVDSVSLSNSSPTSESAVLKINITAYLKMEGA